MLSRSDLSAVAVLGSGLKSRAVLIKLPVGVQSRKGELSLSESMMALIRGAKWC